VRVATGQPQTGQPEREDLLSPHATRLDRRRRRVDPGPGA
jgi:hypothetical protein